MTEPSRPLDTYTIEQLRDPGFARAFLRESLEANDPRIFLKALSLAIKASDKTMTQLADMVGVSREHLHRALSNEGNPSWAMISQLLHGLGYDLSIKKRTKKA